MYKIITCLTTEHDLRIVGLAAIVCIVTVFTAFMTFGHVLDERNPRRHAWLIITGLCAATGIWATHFVAMLAYDSGLPITYEPWVTALSFVVAVLTTTAGFWLLAQVHAARTGLAAAAGAVSPVADLQRRVARELAGPGNRHLASLLAGRWGALAAGGATGAGISLMHFTGMSAVRLAGTIAWDYGLVAVALIFGILFGAAAMSAHAAASRRLAFWGAPLFLVLGICSMHFTAMGAVIVVPDPAIPAPVPYFDTLTFALAIAAVTIAVMFAGFAAALIETTTQNKQLNRELACKLQELKDAQDDIVRKGRMAQLGNLTATVAHELRNPLGAIRTSAFLLERKLKGRELGVEPQIGRIMSGVVRCDGIITQLLDFARNSPLKLSTHAFDSWIADIVEEEAQKLPHAVAFECHLGCADAALAFDADRLQRVLINLLANAAEAMVGKGDDPAKFATGDPRIIVATAATSRGIEITVADNGPGIPPDVLDKIREPLFTTKSFGTGLGIPAVEKIMELHGGGMEIASTEGKGAVFTVWMPARPAAPQVSQAA